MRGIETNQKTGGILMYRHRIGFGFCSYVKPGATEPAEFDVGPERLILLPKWRIRGFAYALQSNLIEELTLMGCEAEVHVYSDRLKAAGVDVGRINSMVTDQSTYGTAVDLWKTLEMLRLPYREWCLITSDYHLRRALLTAVKVHNIAVQNSYGTESLLQQEAFRRGGQTAQRDLIKEMLNSVDPYQFMRRVLWEEKGCAQMCVDPRSYVPMKS